MYSLRVLPRADADAQSIYNWLREFSPIGAVQWYKAFQVRLQHLSVAPQRFGPAEEAAIVDSQLRQALFRTRRGRFYRIVFLIEGENVVVLRVRGPGQAPLSNDDLQYS